MKKILGVAALGICLALGGTTTSFAQATGGPGGAGGPSNGTAAAPMKDSGSGMSDNTKNGSSDAMKKGPVSGNGGSPASQYPAPDNSTK
jgi:hypothetical protein